MAVERTLLESRKFRVERHRVTDRDGATREYDLVAHPGAAVVAPLLADGRMALIYNYRFSVGAELLELPAGTMDGAEAPERCASRELTEETGYQAGRLEHLLTFYSTPGICNEAMHAFVATDLTPGPPKLEPGERIRLALLSWDEIVEALRGGRIQDAKTLVTLLYYDRFRRGGRGL